MNDLLIGGWDDKLDAERLRMEIVEAFEAGISDDAIQKQENLKSSTNSKQSGLGFQS